ncbi:MAG: hypothetical protein JW963_19700 [Anaerolineales bacterium]|nr:hypothetical protein [Anaerolineales bacterium]
MKKLFSFFCIALAGSLACNLFNVPVQRGEPDLSVSTVVAETMQAPPTLEQITTEPAPAFSGTSVEFGNVSLTIPPGVAAGATGIQIPPAGDQDSAPWGVTPGHVELTFDGYTLQDRFHEPKIYVYPASAFAGLSPGAAGNILLLQNILANPGQLSAESQMPGIPFFNAGAVFAAQQQIVQFQNGSGVRMLTQYAQSFAQVNNHELFYHFQGLTSEGQYYIIAILPVSASILAENWEATAPSDGVPFPDYSDTDTDFQAYYDQIIAKLNALPEDAFNPALTKLDTLIGTLQIKP